ncbi:unnamed protein product [Protopolystoma xenopodis]|uniref:Uncharacterized protein n=1 Tax=Protopolystoma xenopodis TaxID=117903 RepID=A0A3S4ZMF2_9PLAT|nr:unnamed protein product [Protopolystoma xenopodis]
MDTSSKVEDEDRESHELMTDEDELKYQEEYEDYCEKKGLLKESFMASSLSINKFFQGPELDSITSKQFLGDKDTDKGVKTPMLSENQPNSNFLSTPSSQPSPRTDEALAYGTKGLAGSTLNRLWVALLDGKAGMPIRRAVWVEIYSGGTVLRIGGEQSADKSHSEPTNLLPTFAVFYHGVPQSDVIESTGDDTAGVNLSSAYCLSLRSTLVEELGPTTMRVVTHSGEGHSLLIEVPRPEDLPAWIRAFQRYPTHDPGGISRKSTSSERLLLRGGNLNTNQNTSINSCQDGSPVGNCYMGSLLSAELSPIVSRRRSLEPLSELSESAEESK